MLTYERGDSIDRVVSEASIEHLASPGVFRRIYGVQSRFFPDVLHQSHVEVTPSNVGLHTIHRRMSLWVTEEDQVWRDADPLAIDLK